MCGKPRACRQYYLERLLASHALHLPFHSPNVRQHFAKYLIIFNFTQYRFELEHENSAYYVWMEAPVGSSWNGTGDLRPTRVASDCYKQIRFVITVRQSHCIQVQLVVKAGRSDERTRKNHWPANIANIMESAGVSLQRIVNRSIRRTPVHRLLPRQTVKRGTSGFILGI
jgi:hypothetical protein